MTVGGVRSRAASIGPLLAGCVYLALIGLCAILAYTPVGADLTPAVQNWIWPTAGVGLIAASLVQFFGLRRMARSYPNRLELAGVLQIAAWFGLLIGLGLASLQLRTAFVIVGSNLVTAEWSWDTQLLNGGGRIRIVGPIGPGFGRHMEQLLEHGPAPVTLEITSDGGLIDEAMRAARAIERRGNVTVIVRDYCASACLIVLMAAPSRLAPGDVILEFHAGASVVDVQDRLIAWVNSQSITASDDYLIGRGVPADIVQETNRLGPSHLYRLPAEVALSRGVLTGLAADDRRPSAGAQGGDVASSARTTAP